MSNLCILDEEVKKFKYDPTKYPHVETVIKVYAPHNLHMMSINRVINILVHLQDAINDDIEGDVVEMGCHAGMTSLSIRKLLDLNESKKEFHVYDSFEGLPDLGEFDLHVEGWWKRGSLASDKDTIVNNFAKANLKLPVFHKGFFSDIPNDEYPQKIAYAFFDGDLYESTMDCFIKTYDKLSVGSRVVIDDYGWGPTPGVRRACENYLAGRSENGKLLELPDGQVSMIKE